MTGAETHAADVAAVHVLVDHKAFGEALSRLLTAARLRVRLEREVSNDAWRAMLNAEVDAENALVRAIEGRS